MSVPSEENSGFAAASKKKHLRKFTSNLIGQEMQRERKENYKKKFHMNDQ